MLLALALIAAALAWLAYEFAVAPEGYEDALGFHLGPYPDAPDHRARGGLDDLPHSTSHSVEAQRDHG